MVLAWGRDSKLDLKIFALVSLVWFGLELARV
jgi:hypothetical protein